MPALAAVEQAVQERLPGSGNAAGFIAIIFGVIIAEGSPTFNRGLIAL
jgi:hypothetical protein